MSEEPQNAMEGRARRRASPAGIRTRPARVEPEPPPSKKPEPRTTRVAVVYYLFRNHQLEHPHFMEVPLASPKGLYLRDVVSRLDALRGKGMAAKYSWSCKRRYKNGFVWHDLSEGDLLLTAQGAEYVLKGSELQLDQLAPDTVSDHQQNSTTSTSNAKVVQFTEPARQQELPHSPAVPVIKKEAIPPPPPQQISSASTIGYDEQCRMPHSSGSSSDSSPKTSSPSSGSSSPGQNNPAAAHDVATQTDDKARGDNTKPQRGQVAAVVITPAERPEIVDESHSKHHRPAAGEYPRSSRRSGTLQSLIRAEAAGRRRDLLVLELEDDDDDVERRRATTGSVSARLKPANLLARLMACGANNQSFGFVQASYKPQRFTQQPEYPCSSSPELFPLGVLKPGATSVSTARASDTENSTGSLHDGATCKLKRSPSSSSLRHEDGVSEEACSSEGDPPVNLRIGTSKRMSGPSSGKVSSFEGGAVPR